MTGTYGDTFFIEQCTDFWHRDAIEHETHDRHAVLGVADERQARNLGELFAGIFRQFVLMCLDVANAKTAYVVEGST